MKYRSFSFLTGHPYAPLVKRYDLPGNEQPDSETRKCILLFTRYPVKPFENLSLSSGAMPIPASCTVTTDRNPAANI